MQIRSFQIVSNVSFFQRPKDLKFSEFLVHFKHFLSETLVWTRLLQSEPTSHVVLAVIITVCSVNISQQASQLRPSPVISGMFLWPSYRLSVESDMIRFCSAGPFVSQHRLLVTVCSCSLSRLNVIFSKFDEVQRSGNMVLSPVSGKITPPALPDALHPWCPGSGCVCGTEMVLSPRWSWSSWQLFVCCCKRPADIDMWRHPKLLHSSLSEPQQTPEPGEDSVFVELLSQSSHIWGDFEEISDRCVSWDEIQPEGEGGASGVHCSSGCRSVATGFNWFRKFVKLLSQ